MKPVTVFTDGSSRGNPGPGGWASVIASDKNVYELSGSEAETTNNRMELTAVIETLKFLQSHRQTRAVIQINTDSQYFKNGFEKWMYGWQKKGWITSKKEPVLNQDLWQKLIDLKPLFSNLTINHVRGHVGIPGNERADELATAAADGQSLTLYRGSREKYTIALDAVMPTKDVVTKSKGKAFCYLSMVDGVIVEHKNWDACKDRVTGQKNAKFRRANSLAERDQIVSSWQE